MIEVKIIGSGVMGLCVASELVDRGAKITVIDRAPEPGPQACSWWAGGMLAPWCEGESAEEPVVRLGKKSLDWWEAKTGGVTRNGSLVIAPGRDQAELRKFGRRTSHFSEVLGEEIAALEPELKGRFSKGLFFKDEGHLAPRQALSTLKGGLLKKGVGFEVKDVEQTIATAGELDRGAPITIDCRGLAASDALSDLRGVKGEMLILSCPEIELSRPIRLLHPRIPLYIVPRGDGLFMLGATMIESSDRNRVSARSMLELLSAAYAVSPLFGEAEVVEIGVDARPAFPDNLPRIRQQGNVIWANGLYRHGFLLAPAVAQMVAGYIFDQDIPEVLNAFSA